jgi:hypothetical protein
MNPGLGYDWTVPRLDHERNTMWKVVWRAAKILLVLLVAAALLSLALAVFVAVVNSFT